ncbi:hypothetical protein [Deinococcus cellulosilyticus]|uniref:Uncharacterized protein n=1 Tax=Deinococcus cellulosilyticus (strain DSM 18568 / NBRC 106333 / KACC 11606 / 5516J-15) TaxID=1223518 RepID=A0A511N5P9_DEIC1|nr:hypothetical protein [Deinococcus cellulosilyticus]GEM48164.1 hypothetical protein DC3_37990 [Deinococcus cellulosilyticus NBRC 106333 = KACC 11606]
MIPACGPYLPELLLEEGDIRTYLGTDTITGMPVLLYLSEHALPFSELSAPHLLPFLDSGTEGRDHYLTAGLPLTFRTLPKTLPRELLEDIWEAGLQMLQGLHEAGKTFGRLTAHHCLLNGKDVLFVGAGLTPGSEKTDIRNLAKLVMHLMGGQSSSELNTVMRNQLERLMQNHFISAAHLLRDLQNRPKTPTQSVLQTVKTTPAEPEPEEVEFEETEIKLDDAPQEPQAPPVVVRIGWDDDESWRQVQSPATAHPAQNQNTSGIMRYLATIGIAVLLLAGAGLGWWYAARQQQAIPEANSPTTCCVVDFSLTRKSQPYNAQAKLIAVKVPEGSSYKAGDTLGLVPGPVRFPSVKGEYVLKVEVPGLRTAPFQLDMPTSGPMTIDLQ